MSMTDPIADMLTRIRNAQMIGARTVVMPVVQGEVAIAKVLKDEGYIDGFKVAGEERASRARDRAAATTPAARSSSSIERVSQPGPAHLQEQGRDPAVMNGLGIAIVSTSHGVMTDRKARATGVGGEVLCIVA